MASRVPLARVRRRIEHRRVLEYRLAREGALDAAEAEWYLTLDDDPGGAHDPVEPFLREPLHFALDRLLDDSLVLGRREQARASAERLRCELAPLPDLAVEEEGEATSESSVELERLAARWAARLRSDPATLLDELGGIVEADDLAVLRALAHEKLEGRSFAALAWDHRWGDTWHRCLAIAVLAYPLWTRPLSGWRGTTRQALLQHLLGDFAAAPVLYHWALETPDIGFDGTVWLACRLSGCSVRRVLRELGLAIAATDVAAVEALAVDESFWLGGLEERLACADVLRAGASSLDWRRLSGQGGLPLRAGPRVDAAPTRVQRPRVFDRYAHRCPDEPLAWRDHRRDTAKWLARHCDALDDHEVADLLEWALAMFTQGQQPGHVPFAWRRRPLDAVREAVADHLLGPDRVAFVSWPGHGWDTAMVGRDGQSWQFRELNSTTDLAREGAAQRHCVAQYGELCAAGRSAIVQVRCNGSRCLTLEVDPGSARVVQVRGRFNSRADAAAEAAVREWAHGVGLQVADSAL
jgi:hypothetical protein